MPGWLGVRPSVQCQSLQMPACWGGWTSYAAAQAARAAVCRLLHLTAHSNRWLNSVALQKICSIFADLTKNVAIILIHSHQAAIIVLAIDIF